jgi:hypothetical protein
LPWAPLELTLTRSLQAPSETAARAAMAAERARARDTKRS